jgi:hypothetical protein
MGDYTSYHLRIKVDDLSAKRQQRIADLFDEGITIPTTSVWGAQVDVAAGDFDVDEKRVGETQSIADSLIAYLTKKGIDRPFEVWEEPKYEWLGSLYHHDPDGRDTYGDCDAEGNLVVQHEAVLLALSKADTIAEAKDLITGLVAVTS